VRQTLADDTTDNVQTWYDYDNPNDKAPFGADGTRRAARWLGRALAGTD